MLPLAKLLSRMLKDLNLDGDAKRYEAINKWEEIVGPTIAAVTEPERISHGTLVVKVNSSVWKYELTMRKMEILEKVREKIGTVDVKDIQWK
jgi:predicted nucleic acid-binding Zn ribbon protein